MQMYAAWAVTIAVNLSNCFMDNTYVVLLFISDGKFDQIY